MKPGDLVQRSGVNNYTGVFLKELTPRHLRFQRDIKMGEFFILGKVVCLSMNGFQVIQAPVSS